MVFGRAFMGAHGPPSNHYPQDGQGQVEKAGGNARESEAGGGKRHHLIHEKFLCLSLRKPNPSGVARHIRLAEKGNEDRSRKIRAGDCWISWCCHGCKLETGNHMSVRDNFKAFTKMWYTLEIRSQ